MAVGAVAIPGLEELRKTAAKKMRRPSGPPRSVLVRSKGSGGRAKAGAKGLGAIKSARKGVGSEVAKAHKLAAPVKGGASKELGKVKKSLAAHKAAAVKAAGPARSVMIKQKGLAAKDIRSAKKALGGRIGGLKRLKKTAASSKPIESLGKAGKSIGKAGALANKAQPQAGRAVQAGRLLRSI
jgi:hypothetical protein